MPSEDIIGIFDSGVGGLSVLRHIRALLPAENLLYLADSGFAPYGNKSASWIQQRSFELTAFLLDQGAKAIVVACNTATAAAAPALRERFAAPIVGMEPAVKPAAQSTRSGVVGVLATVGTIHSARFAALRERFAQGITVVTQPCPGLVEQIEQGELQTDATRKLLESYVRPLLEKGADTLVLGCTHYPFLRPLIEQIAGPQVAIIDTGAPVARQLVKRLKEEDLFFEGQRAGSETFYASGNVAMASRVISLLLSRDVEAQPFCDFNFDFPCAPSTAC